jgi:hypothetical protein
VVLEVMLNAKGATLVAYFASDNPVRLPNIS